MGYLAQFVARAVVDELLPPRYLMNERSAALGGNIVQNARTLLSMKHAPSRVERVWGPGASEYAEDLKRTIKMICAEFLDNTDLEETALSLRMLEAPRYMHELSSACLSCHSTGPPSCMSVSVICLSSSPTRVSFPCRS